jgi:FkbM family methyltransferase
MNSLSSSTSEPNDDRFVTTEIRFDDRSYNIAHLDANDHIFKVLTSTSTFYELELLDVLRRLLKPGDLVVDVGANIGNHTVFFAGVCKCRVISIEPHPVAFKILKENIRINNLEGRVVSHNLALGQSRGTATFEPTPDHNLGASTLTTEQGAIPVVTLDELVARQRPRLIKVDVEGMEFLVLLGASRTLQASRPMVCVEAKDEVAFSKIFEYLSRFALFVGGVYNFSPTHVFFPSRLLQLTPLLSTLSRWVGTLYIQRQAQDAKFGYRLGMLAARIEALETASKDNESLIKSTVENKTPEP